MDTFVEDLSALDGEALVDALILIAQRARTAVAQGDRLTPLRDLRKVLSAAKKAKGDRLALLEVSENFLKALAQVNFGQVELALREFLEDFPEEGAAFLEEIVDRPRSEASLERYPTRLRSGIAHLREVGLLRLEASRVDVRPEWRMVVRDLLEAPVFRHWREVDQARATVMLSRLDRQTAATYLASQFGVDEGAAHRFLKRSGLRHQVHSARVISRPRIEPRADLAPETSTNDGPSSAERVEPRFSPAMENTQAFGARTESARPLAGLVN